MDRDRQTDMMIDEFFNFMQKKAKEVFTTQTYR